MGAILLHRGANLLALRGRKIEIARNLGPAPPGVDALGHLRRQARGEQQRQEEHAWHLFILRLFPEQPVHRLDGFGLVALLHGG